QRHETIGPAECRKARIERIDEHDAARSLDAEFVDVDIARHLRVAGNVEAVEALIRIFAGTQHVFEPPDLVEGGEVYAVGFGVHAHGAYEMALMERQPPVRQYADQKQF